MRRPLFDESFFLALSESVHYSDDSFRVMAIVLWGYGVGLRHHVAADLLRFAPQA
jgi:hypothetical protein